MTRDAMNTRSSHKTAKTTQERDTLTGRYGADWLTPLRREMVDLIRTEIRRRHRQAVFEECRKIEAAANARLDDCVGLGSVPEFRAFEEIEKFCSLSRREIFKAFGNYRTKKQLEGVAEYREPASRARSAAGDGRR